MGGFKPTHSRYLEHVSLALLHRISGSKMSVTDRYVQWRPKHYNLTLGPQTPENPTQCVCIWPANLTFGEALEHGRFSDAHPEGFAGAPRMIKDDALPRVFSLKRSWGSATLLRETIQPLLR